jgi:peptide/nickel transport system permease protein
MFALLIAILGYLITPDPTPYSNRQVIEIAMNKPGFRVTMLKVRKNEIQPATNLFRRLVWGKKDEYGYIPVQDIQLIDGKVIVEGYTGHDEMEGIQSRYNLADVLYPINMGRISLTDDGKISFQTLDGQELIYTIPELEGKLLKENLVEKRFLLGTDQFGRDMLSRLMIGTRVSLSVGLIAVTISLVIGIFIGSLGGYFRGWADQVVMWVINVVWSIPTLLLVIALAFALGKGYWQVFVAVGLTMWVEVARVTRGQIISIREKEYTEAAKALGFSHWRIITRHILPNITGPLIVISAANFASAILIEAGLSFLGIGIQPPMPSWGGMIRENYPYIILDYAYLAILPGMAIMLMVLAFMICGNGLRDALDVKISEKSGW